MEIVSQHKSYVYAFLSCPSLFFLPGKESERQGRLFSRSIVSGVSLLLCICSDPKMCFKMYLESSYTSKKAFAMGFTRYIESVACCCVFVEISNFAFKMQTKLTRKI